MVRSKVVPRTAGALVFLLGALSLTGWIFDIHFKPLFSGLVAMKANTAICFMLGGLSLFLQAQQETTPPKRLLLVRLLALIIIVVALITSVEYAFQVDLDIDQMFFQESSQEAGLSFPGRMAPASAANFLLTGLALFILDLPRGQNRYAPAQYLSFVSLAITLLAFIGYFYGVEIPRRLAPYVTIALHTVIGFAVLNLGILFARPERGVIAILTSNSPGSAVARRLVPAAILFPLLVGWVSVLSERAGHIGLGFGTGLLVLSLILAFTSLIAWAAHGLNQTDAERKKIQEELVMSREQLRALAGRLQAAREQERATVAREIHDTMAQELTRLKLDISWLNRRISKTLNEQDRGPLQEKINSMRDAADASITTVQRLATELRPVVLDTLGLYAAIEWQVRDFEARTGLHCETFLPEESPRMDPERSTALFRILQESLTNIARHAQATKIEVSLHVETDRVLLTIHDNGAGIAPEKLDDPRSLGLTGMRERATLLGGTCRFMRSPLGGTGVEVTLALPSAEPIAANTL